MLTYGGVVRFWNTSGGWNFHRVARFLHRADRIPDGVADSGGTIIPGRGENQRPGGRYARKSRWEWTDQWWSDQWAISPTFFNGIYWGYNPLTNLLLTFWDIQVGPGGKKEKRVFFLGGWGFVGRGWESTWNSLDFFGGFKRFFEWIFTQQNPLGHDPIWQTRIFFKFIWNYQP